MEESVRPKTHALAACFLSLAISACSPSSAPGRVPPALSAGPSPLDSEETAFVGLINAYRQQNGVVVLQVSATLTAASQWLAHDMATQNYLDHTDSLGRDFVTRLADFGYSSATYMGENIAAGNVSAQSTFTQWQNSPPHNANMLDGDYLALGVGRAYGGSSDYGWYWVTDFGSTLDSTLPLDQKK